jgi:hypothetical protein
MEHTFKRLLRSAMPRLTFGIPKKLAKWIFRRCAKLKILPIPNLNSRVPEDLVKYEVPDCSGLFNEIYDEYFRRQCFADAFFWHRVADKDMLFGFRFCKPVYGAGVFVQFWIDSYYPGSELLFLSNQSVLDFDFVFGDSVRVSVCADRLYHSFYDSFMSEDSDFNLSCVYSARLLNPFLLSSAFALYPLKSVVARLYKTEFEVSLNYNLPLISDRILSLYICR